VKAFLSRAFSTLTAAGARFSAAAGPQHAAAIAYRVLFSLAPLVIVLVSAFGLLLGNDELRDSVTGSLVDALPVDAAGGEDVEEAIESLATTAGSGAAGIASLIAFVWAASGMMSAVRGAIDRMTGETEGRPLARGKLLDLALVAAAAALVLLSVGIGFLAQYVNGLISKLAGLLGTQGDVAELTVSTLLSFSLWGITALLVYRFVPQRSPRLRDALAGALVTATALLMLSFVAELLYAKTTQWSLIYGSLTSLLVFLYSVYLFATALLFGAAVTAEWSQPREPGPSEPLAAKMRNVIRGLWVRRAGGDAR